MSLYVSNVLEVLSDDWNSFALVNVHGGEKLVRMSLFSLHEVEIDASLRYIAKIQVVLSVIVHFEFLLAEAQDRNVRVWMLVLVLQILFLLTFEVFDRVDIRSDDAHYPLVRTEVVMSVDFIGLVLNFVLP